MPSVNIQLERTSDQELNAFPSEISGPVRPAAVARGRRRWVIAAAILGCLTMVGAGAWAYRFLASATTGSLRIETDPAGAEVTLDGTARGTTPLAVSVAGGDHVLSVRQGDRVKVLTVTVARGVETVHHIAWAHPAGSTPAEAPAAAARGGLQVVTDRPGAPVAVDGVARGVSPLVLSDLAPGNHQVEVGSAGAVQRRTVEIHGGSVASLVLGAGTVPTSGWMSVAAPFPLQIYENGQLIGTSEAERIMLPTGSHQFELASDALGFRSQSAVRIEPGQTARLRVDLPRGRLSINATPWAEVWIDGARLGETPLGNLQAPIGPHQLEFRHPQLGSKRVTATISLKDVTRIAVDMRKP
jgi:hypothetical protein